MVIKNLQIRRKLKTMVGSLKYLSEIWGPDWILQLKKHIDPGNTIIQRKF